MTHPKVFVVGMGAISSIGNSPEEMLNSLIREQHGLSPVKHFTPNFPFTPLVGEVAWSNTELAHRLQLPDTRTYSRTYLLGLWAARQAIQGISNNQLAQAAFLSSSTVGGMDQSEKLFFQKTREGREVTSETIQGHDCGAATEEIARQLGINGLVTTINTACSSSANAIMLGARMICAGETDLVIAGGADSLAEFTLQGFRTLMLVSESYCKPFDAARNGLNLGEGAAFLVLCSEKFLSEYTPVAELRGWANANDANHATASSPEGNGAQASIRQALKKASLQPEEIDYINVHGTATENNDRTEGAAMAAVFSTVPPFSSTKSFTGHTLAASGALEAVISCLSLQSGYTFASLHFTTPMEATPLVPIQKSARTNPVSILSNSFGFGGNCSSLIFRKI